MSKARNIWSGYKCECDAVEPAAMSTSRQERGASMPLALLLFLVCAMAAAIVLAASTTTSGRASQLAESDQLYYLLTSEANAFRSDLINGGTGHTVTVAVRMEVTDDTVSNPVLRMMFDGSSDDVGIYNVLERAAIRALFGANAESTEEAQDVVEAYFGTGDWSSFGETLTSGSLASYQLKHTSTPSGGLSSTEVEALDTDLTVNIDEYGNLVFTFKKEIDGNNARLVLSCDADCSVETIETNASDAERQFIIKYVTISWTPSKLEKG